MKTTPLMTRILAAIKDGPVGPFLSRCWVWQRTISPTGYGMMGVKIGNGWQTRHAHRVSYECFIGPIPIGLDLDHLCRNRRCVNPNHLEPVTRAENLRRGLHSNGQGRKIHCPSGHFYSATNNRGERICHKCAATATRRYREQQ